MSSEHRDIQWCKQIQQDKHPMAKAELLTALLGYQIIAWHMGFYALKVSELLLTTAITVHVSSIDWSHEGKVVAMPSA